MTSVLTSQTLKRYIMKKRMGKILPRNKNTVPSDEQRIMDCLSCIETDAKDEFKVSTDRYQSITSYPAWDEMKVEFGEPSVTHFPLEDKDGESTDMIHVRVDVTVTWLFDPHK